jgi:restriction system protein
MPIPSFEDLMNPLLQIIRDGNEHRLKVITNGISDKLNLTEEEKIQLMPGRNEKLFSNRVAWARAHLKKAGLIDAPRRGVVKITERGIKALKENQAIDRKYLTQFSEYNVGWGRTITQTENNTGTTVSPKELTPDENLDEIYEDINNRLIDDILEQIQNLSPKFFEKLVIEVLVKMGYGGSFDDAIQHVGKVADGGIDGIIKEDRLGLENIYIQAKRWKNPVSNKEIRDFVGALAGKNSVKGVFITSSSFTKNAVDYVDELSSYKVILIDGRDLAKFMIEFNVGTTISKKYSIKKIDNDYFDIEDS